ncbi:MAG: triose-phosphate isomerase [Sedimentisphaerales bacterium]|nr:triose-phosphate isomerase [Sedimentisphaerales bacterium]
MRRPFVAGNWKMNTDLNSAVALARAVSDGVNGLTRSMTIAVCPPFVYLKAVADAVKGSGVAVGAQDVYFQPNGAFTGEISVAMLKDVGCTYVICGHSDRRHVIGEQDDLINKKLLAVLAGGLRPILCVGELLEQRDANQTESVVEGQLRSGLKGVSAGQMGSVTIAYEPVWAIGTGRTATPQQAQEVHRFIRDLLEDMYGQQVAQATIIQYGGSVKASNAADLMAQPDVDGLLVGGASLKADEFLGILKASAGSADGLA